MYTLYYTVYTIHYSILFSTYNCSCIACIRYAAFTRTQPCPIVIARYVSLVTPTHIGGRSTNDSHTFIYKLLIINS